MSSARGSLKLFKDLEISTIIAVDSSIKKQGRSAQLHSRRNDCLVDRYYFYFAFTDKRYTSILEDLSEEFFINSTFTIPQVLDEYYEALVALRNKKPDIGYFKKKWPHLVWINEKA